jgi:hypothetical protein
MEEEERGRRGDGGVQNRTRGGKGAHRTRGGGGGGRGILGEGGGEGREGGGGVDGGVKHGRFGREGDILNNRGEGGEGVHMWKLGGKGRKERKGTIRGGEGRGEGGGRPAPSTITRTDILQMRQRPVAQNCTFNFCGKVSGKRKHEGRRRGKGKGLVITMWGRENWGGFMISHPLSCVGCDHMVKKNGRGA